VKREKSLYRLTIFLKIKKVTYVTLLRELGNKPRWKTNSRPRGDIAKEAIHLKSLVAGILLANYEVIGKLSRRGTRLAALYLITSNKRYSSPLLFLLPFFSSLVFFLFFFARSFCVFILSRFRFLPLHFLSFSLSLSLSLSLFLSLSQHAANVFTCIILKRLISLAMSRLFGDTALHRYRSLSV